MESSTALSNSLMKNKPIECRKANAGRAHMDRDRSQVSATIERIISDAGHVVSLTVRGYGFWYNNHIDRIWTISIDTIRYLCVVSIKVVVNAVNFGIIGEGVVACHQTEA